MLVTIYKPPVINSLFKLGMEASTFAISETILANYVTPKHFVVKVREDIKIFQE